MPDSSTIQWPGGKKFAFTVFDDTDFASIEKLKPVYNLLAECGLRTTKSVWPLAGSGVPACGGDTCESPDYLKWVTQLQANGFEIALHNATYHTSSREQTRRGLDRFRELFGHDPLCFANHTGCDEDIYWGDARLTGGRRHAYNLLTRFRHRGQYRGHVQGDPLFWGDLCTQRIRYVRNFTFSDINTLRACPWMPYHDPNRPFVNHWFASTEGGNVAAFVRSINENAQDRLVEQGGACIMYTHFAVGFYDGGQVQAEFTRLLRRLAALDGWFVPVSTLLDFLRAQRRDTSIGNRELAQLEWRWLKHKVRYGHS